MCAAYSHIIGGRKKLERQTYRERKGIERRRKNTNEGIKGKQWENLGKAHSRFFVLFL